MSWKESDRVSERLEFVRLASMDGANISLLCERFGVSRKTGYKWLNRWKSEGDSGLLDQSRRPAASPNQTSPSVESQVVKLRRMHPAWGGRTLRRRLLDLGYQNVPSASSITRVLHRHGLISPSESSKRRAWKSFEREAPNELWQVDFKGDFVMTGGKRCYPLTILDDHSRYALGIIACENQQRVTVKDHFRDVFQKHGIPRAIYVDNGNPWGNANGRSRHTRLSTWLMRHDIEVIHGRPYHPQGRGKIERFHRTLKLEVLQDRCLGNLSDAQQAFDPWRGIYNFERPHQSLDLAVPGSRYTPSDRAFQEVTQAFEYSDRFEVRKVDKTTNKFYFQGKRYRFSEAFLDQSIGLAPTEAEGVWDIYFCRFKVAQLTLSTGQIIYDRRLAESRYARFSQAAEASETLQKQ